MKVSFHNWESSVSYYKESLGTSHTLLHQFIHLIYLSDMERVDEWKLNAVL